MAVPESAQIPAWPLHACTHSVCSHCHWTHPSHGSTTNPLRCPAGTEFTKPPVVCKSRGHRALKALKFQPYIWSHASHGYQLGFQPCLYMWAAYQCLQTPRVHRRGAVPFLSTLRMTLLWQAPPLPLGMHINNGTSVVDPGWGSFVSDLQFWLGLDHTLATAAVSAQISPAFSLGLPSEVGGECSVPEHTSSRASWIGEHRVLAESLCAGFSVSPAASQRVCSPLSLWSFLSVLADLPTGEGAAQGEGTFPLHSFFPRDKSCPDSCLCFHPIWSYGDLSCIFFFFFVFWDPPPAFSKYFVRIIPHVDVFLMYLWDEVSSTSFYSPILIWPPKLLNTLCTN